MSLLLARTGGSSTLTLDVPAATATVASVAPSLADTYTVSPLSASVAAVAPSLPGTYTVSSLTATVAVVAPTLASTLTAPAMSASVSTSAQSEVTYSAPTATGTVAMVPPTLAFVTELNLDVPTATATAAAQAPAAEFTYTVPTIAVSAEMVAPDITPNTAQPSTHVAAGFYRLPVPPRQPKAPAKTLGEVAYAAPPAHVAAFMPAPSLDLRPTPASILASVGVIAETLYDQQQDELAAVRMLSIF